MKYYNGKNIITDEDVTLTSTGESLRQVLDKQRGEINDLLSEMKFYYKYGGVGGGKGGSGSGGGEASVNATINGVALTKNGTSVTLNGVGTYVVNVSMKNPQSHLFTVQIDYPTASGTALKKVNLPNGQGLYSTQVSVDLTANGSISVSAYDKDTGSTTDVIQTFCIVTPYRIRQTIVDADKRAVLTELGEVFIDNINTSGMYAMIDYDFAIDADVAYVIRLNGLVLDANLIADKVGTLLIPIYNPGEVTLDLAGNYLIDFITTIVPKAAGSKASEVAESINYALLPNLLYISCTSAKGSIYTVPLEQNTYNHLLSVEITPIVYEGMTPQDRQYNVYYKFVSLEDYLANPQVSVQDATSLTLRERNASTKITLTSADAGCKVLVLRVDALESQLTLTKPFYIYFADFSGLNYFRTGLDVRDSFYYRSPYADSLSGFKNFYEKSRVEQNSNGSAINVAGLSTTDSIHTSTHVSFGILLSEVHNVDNPIIRINTVNSNNAITIYQNKIVFGTSGDSANTKKIFIPLVEVLSGSGAYHLVSIYSRLKKKVGNTNYYERVIYIDGVPEAALIAYSTADLAVRSIDFLPGNYYINQADVSYLAVEEDGLPYSDLDENIYYLAYKLNVLLKSIGDDYNNLVTLLTSQKLDDREWIEVTSDFILLCKNTSGVPVLTFEYYPLLDTTSSVNDFRTYIDTSFLNENDGKAVFPIAVEYSKANDSTISYYSGNSGILFSMSLQGSSTRRNISKNFTLAVQPSSDTTYFFSPNYSPRTPESFRPETSFTLKADVVDSSHSNNVAMGKFVNANTTKFSSDAAVKNCLDGFPILIFIKIFSGTTNMSDYKSYYFGIYNFNLGRESYSNLGYYLPESLNRILAAADSTRMGEFQVLGVQTGGDAGSPLLIRNDITIAEIGDGNDYHDFSLCDNSILFDTDGMAGMFGDIVPGGALLESTDKPRIAGFVEKVAKAGGYLFRNVMNKTFNPSLSDGYHKSLTNNEFDFNSYNGVPDCTKLWQKYLNANGKADYKLKSSGTGLINSSLLVVDSLSELIEDSEDSPRLYMLNLQSAVEYYTICMAFGLVDSVQKNLNIKTFNSGKEFVIAFYDMDTCLGIDNNANLVTWFAFSDYWRETEDRSIVNYSDYYPKRTDNNAAVLDIGFDIPSSYLFAVAKYTTLVLSYRDLISPLDLWASWRGQGAILETADAFIDNYYSKLLKDIPDALFNLNYRFKYMRSSGNGLILDSNNLMGRGIERVRNWLKGRFHLLDAYFNLPCLNYPIGYRDNTTQSLPWKSHETYREIVPKNDYAMNDTSNTDIIVLHDIFSADLKQALKVTTSGSFNFTAKEYSPVIVTKGDATNDGTYTVRTPVARYLVTDPEHIYTINIEANGNQTISIGGSANFTSLTKCGLFVDNSNKLTINSKYLQSLQGDNGIISSFELITPALQTLNLNCTGTAAKYSGVLDFTNNGTTDNYPNLKTVDIAGTAINLTINNESVTNVNLSRTKSDSVSLLNCNYLEEVLINDTLIADLAINPVWDNNIELKNNRIKNLNLGGKNGSISITNDNDLTLLTLSNFKTITVTNCPNITTLNLPSGKIEGVIEDLLTKLSLAGATKVTTLDLSLHDNLTYLDLTNCSELNTLILSVKAQKELTTLMISGTKLSEILWYDPETGETINPGCIDLREAESLTLPTSTFLCANNPEVRIVKFPNMKTDSDSVYLKDHVSAAVYCGTFNGCKNLLRIYGNVIVTQAGSFNGCTNFSIHGTGDIKYGTSEVTIPQPRAPYMPYQFYGGYWNEDILPKSKYFSIEDYIAYVDSTATLAKFQSMDVLFSSDSEDDLATNMSFDTKNFNQMFYDTSCTLFDIGYVFSNLMAVSEVNRKEVSVVNTFGKLKNSVFNYGMPLYLLHNTENIISFNPFSYNSTSLTCLYLLSPTWAGDKWINNGFYSPLYPTCTTLSRLNNSNRGILIDKNFFKGTFDTKCALLSLTAFTNLFIGEDLDLNRYVYTSIARAPLMPTDEFKAGDGNLEGFFDDCTQLTTINNSFTEIYMLQFDTISLPDTVKTVSNSFVSQYGCGEININKLFKYNPTTNSNSVEEISESFISQLNVSIYNDYFAGTTISDASIAITNNLLEKFGKLLYWDPTVGSDDRVSFSGNIYKIIDYDDFPYDILYNCPNHENLISIRRIFSGRMKSLPTSPIALPGNLFRGCTLLEDISYGFYANGFQYYLTSDSFVDCHALLNVSYCFSLPSLSLNKLNGFIPYHLFYLGTFHNIKNMSYCFLNSSIDPYENENPTSIWDFDGVHVGSLTGVEAKTIDTNASIKLPKVVEFYETDDITKVSREWRLDESMLPIGNYCCAPDLLQYCTSSVNVIGLFRNCGPTDHRNLSGNMPGIKGRIPENLLSTANSRIVDISEMFMNCKGITGYNVTDDEGNSRVYVIPEEFFKNNTTLTTLKYTFSGMIFPHNVTFKDVFTKLIYKVYSQYMFYNCWWESYEENGILTVCRIDDEMFVVGPHNMEGMFAFYKTNAPAAPIPENYTLYAEQFIYFGDFLKNYEPSTKATYVFMNYNDDEANKHIRFSLNIFNFIPKDTEGLPPCYNYKRRDYNSSNGNVYFDIV